MSLERGIRYGDWIIGDVVDSSCWLVFVLTLQVLKFVRFVQRLVCGAFPADGVGLFAIRDRRKAISEKDFLNAVDKVWIPLVIGWIRSSRVTRSSPRPPNTWSIIKWNLFVVCFVQKKNTNKLKTVSICFHNKRIKTSEGDHYSTPIMSTANTIEIMMHPQSEKKQNGNLILNRQVHIDINIYLRMKTYHHTKPIYTCTLNN